MLTLLPISTGQHKRLAPKSLAVRCLEKDTSHHETDMFKFANMTTGTCTKTECCLKENVLIMPLVGKKCFPTGFVLTQLKETALGPAVSEEPTAELQFYPSNTIKNTSAQSRVHQLYPLTRSHQDRNTEQSNRFIINKRNH